jgi:hypothetical protein
MSNPFVQQIQINPDDPTANAYQIQRAQAVAKMLQDQASDPELGMPQHSPMAVASPWSVLVKGLMGYAAGQKQAEVANALKQQDALQKDRNTGMVNTLTARPQQLNSVDQTDAPVALTSLPDKNDPQAAKQLAGLLQGMNPQDQNKLLTQKMADQMFPKAPTYHSIGQGDGVLDESTGQVTPGMPPKPEKAPAPLTEIGKLNAALASGEITKDQYDKKMVLETTRAPNASIDLMTNPTVQAGVDSDAKLVARGLAPLPPMGGFGASGIRNAQVRQKAMELNPNLDGTLYTKRQAVERSFSASVDGRNMDSYNTIAQHLDVGEKAYAALQNGNIPVLQNIANTFGIKYEGKAPADVYRNIATFLGNETARATIGGTNGEGDRQALSKMFSDAASPDQAASNYAAAKALIGGRIKSTRQRFESSAATFDPATQAMITNPQEFDAKLTPAAKQFETLAVGGQTPPSGGGAPQAALDYLKAHPEAAGAFKAKYGYAP